MKNLHCHLMKICLIIVGLALAFVIPAQTKSDNKTVLANFEKNIENGKLTEIERDLFSYVIANPQDAKGFSLLARLRFGQNRLSEAKSLASKALSLDPDLITAKLTLVQTSTQLGELDRSRELLGSISERDLSDNSLRLLTAQNWMLTGDCRKALELAGKLPIKLRNGEALALRATCYLEAGDQKNLVTLIPIANPLAKTAPKLAVNFAEVLYKGGLFTESRDLLRLTINNYPQDIDAIVLLARAEIALKDFRNAKIHLIRAEKIEPVSERIFFLGSLLESEQGNDQRAFDLLEKSLSLNSSNLQTLSQFVGVALRVNQRVKAVRAAERLLSLAPDNPEFLYLFGIASLQNNDLQKAESSLVKYLDARPDDSRGCLALGLIYAGQAEKIEEARRQLQKCLQINPNNFEAAYQLGLSYKAQGDSKMASKFFEQTVKLSPDYAAAWRDLGTAYLQTGSESEALQSLEKSVRLNPNDADTHFQLSRLYNLLGERELAKKHLEIFQKLKNPRKEGM